MLPDYVCPFIQHNAVIPIEWKIYYDSVWNSEQPWKILPVKGRLTTLMLPLLPSSCSSQPPACFTWRQSTKAGSHDRQRAASKCGRSGLTAFLVYTPLQCSIELTAFRWREKIDSCVTKASDVLWTVIAETRRGGRANAQTLASLLWRPRELFFFFWCGCNACNSSRYSELYLPVNGGDCVGCSFCHRHGAPSWPVSVSLFFPSSDVSSMSDTRRLLRYLLAGS